LRTSAWNRNRPFALAVANGRFVSRLCKNVTIAGR
jgi:hypothetical protein